MTPTCFREIEYRPIRIIDAGAALRALGHSDPTGSPGGFSRTRERMVDGAQGEQLPALGKPLPLARVS